MREAIIYSHDIGEVLLNSNGATEKVRAWAADGVVNGHWNRVEVVRIPRRLQWNRRTNQLEPRNRRNW